MGLCYLGFELLVAWVLIADRFVVRLFWAGRFLWIAWLVSCPMDVL